MPIRIKDIDTPELRGKCQAEKEAARAAKQFSVATYYGGKKVSWC